MVVEGKSGGKSEKMEIVKVTGAIITSKNQFLIHKKVIRVRSHVNEHIFERYSIFY